MRAGPGRAAGFALGCWKAWKAWRGLEAWSAGRGAKPAAKGLDGAGMLPSAAALWAWGVWNRASAYDLARELSELPGGAGALGAFLGGWQYGAFPLSMGGAAGCFDPMREAAREGRASLAGALWENGWPQGGLLGSEHWSWGGGPLHLASEAGHIGVCEALLARGADVNEPDAQGLTPACRALERAYWDEKKRPGCLGAFLLLAGRGADLEARVRISDCLEMSLFDYLCSSAKVDGFFKVMCAAVSMNEADPERFGALEKRALSWLSGNGALEARFRGYAAGCRERRALSEAVRPQGAAAEAGKGQAGAAAGQESGGKRL